jgi:hypothetical protein
MRPQCKASFREKTTPPRKKRHPWRVLSETALCGDVHTHNPKEALSEDQLRTLFVAQARLLAVRAESGVAIDARSVVNLVHTYCAITVGGD